MIPLETPRLIIRTWEERDRGVFHAINSDEKIMEFFPFRRSRAEADAAMDLWRATIADTGYGFTAIELKSTGECIGTCGMGFFTLEPLFPQGTVEIGWRLVERHWGKGYVTEAANALIADAFTARGLEEIISFAVPANTRSTAVMQRIGMMRDPAADFDHPKVSDTHPHLKRHVTYRLSKSDWERQQKS